LDLEDVTNLDLLSEAVGRVAIQSAVLEDAARAPYASALDTDVSYLAAAGLSFGNLHRNLLALQSEVLVCLDDPEFRAALAEAKELHERRNEVVHAVWLPAFTHEGHFVAYRTRQGKARPQTRNWTTQEMHALADDLRASADRVLALLGSIRRRR
jgi:hypothetical protein